jgi:hypothetical protein
MRQTAKTVTERGQSKPPQALAGFIELVNVERLFERELPDPFAAALFDPRNTSMPPRDVYIEHCEKAAASLSPETRAFLGPASDLEVFPVKYQLLKSARAVLLGIARRNEAGSREHSSELMLRDAQFPGVDIPFAVFVNLVVNEHGEFSISTPPVLAALIGVRADRIRSCAICGRIFWAPRINSECCRPRCRKTYNQRHSRENRRLRRRKETRTVRKKGAT